MASLIATAVVYLSFLLSCLCDETTVVKEIVNSTEPERSATETGEWIPFRGKEYLLVMDAARRQDLNRNDAMQRCLDLGAILVAVEVEEEFEFLKREIRRRVTTIGQEFAHEQWWTAGRVQNDVWVWDKGNRPQVTVSALKRKHIAKGDEHNFLALSHGHEQQGWRLRSVRGNYKLRYICEKERFPCDDEGSLERHLQYFLYKTSGRHQPQHQQQQEQREMLSSEDAAGGHRLKPIQVSITVESIAINKLDEEQNSLCTNTKLILDWTDRQLQWNETQFSNISSITLSSQKLWAPQITIFNSASGQDELAMGLVVVRSSGRAQTKVTDDDLCFGCHRDALFFPFDRFLCFIQLGSASTTTRLRLRSTLTPSVSWFSHSSPWNLEKSSQSFRINCSPSPTPADDGFHHSTSSGCVQLEFYLRRPLLYYVVVLLVPVLLLTMPLLALLFVSSSYHLKTPAMLVLVLLFFLVLHFICTLTPSGSTVIPIIAVYPICLMFIASTSASISLISSRYRQNRTCASLPSCCQRRPETKATEEEKWLSSAQKTDLCSCTSMDLNSKTTTSTAAGTNEYRLQNRKSISWLDEKTPETVETFLDGPEFRSAEIVFNDTETTNKKKQWKACGLVPPCAWNSSSSAAAVRDETQVERNEQPVSCDHRPVEDSCGKSDDGCCANWKMLSAERKLDLVLFAITVVLLVGYSSWILRSSITTRTFV